MIDFSPTPEQEQLRRITTQLMERYVYPAEEHLADAFDPAAPSFFPGIPDSVLRPIQAKVKELGLWAPHMPEDAGGMGIGVVGLGLMNEIIGRSPLGPVSFGCQAPDAGNCEILHMYGTEEQKRAWLLPNVAGEVRSCFSMTEPEVSGADPTNLQTTAELEGESGYQRTQVVHLRSDRRLLRHRHGEDGAPRADPARSLQHDRGAASL